ncbi:MAG: hypothetical protein AMS16_05745, partial [Planctomycetes bacterium DG_58]
MRPMWAAAMVFGVLLAVSCPLAADYCKGDDPVQWSLRVDLDSGQNAPSLGRCPAEAKPSRVVAEDWPRPDGPSVTEFRCDPAAADYSLWGASVYDEQGRIQIPTEPGTIPEPASMAIVGTAALTVVGLIRRRRIDRHG